MDILRSEGQDLRSEALFPFAHIRQEQKRMLEDVITILKEGKSLLAHAPTGIGKTAASLPPALAYGIQNGKTVFFLTPKHSQHHIAVETLKKIRDTHGKKIVAVDIVGKQWTCPYEGARELGPSEFAHFCQAHKRNETCGFCNRVYDPSSKELSKEAKEAVEEIKKRSPLHSEEMAEICKKWDLCPYEIGTLVGRAANVVICDYYHIFHPHVRHAFLKKMGKQLEDMVLIVDEAHNLPGRIRDLMSSSLSEYTISNAVKEARALREGNIEEDLESITGVMKKIAKGMRGDEVFVKKGEFADSIKQAAGVDAEALANDLEALGEIVLGLPNRYKSYCITVAEFLRQWAGIEDETVHARILDCYKSQTGRRYQISIKCLDPGTYSSEVFEQAHASILMSGTLLPLEMYEAVLGLKEARMEQYHNPFPPENRLMVMTPGITTKYTQRSEYMWKKISVNLSRIIENVPGNVAVFFPSYDIMRRIAAMVKISGKEVLVETQDMKKAQRHELYKRMVHLSETDGGVLFAVQAGSFSEGMDFPGRVLDCVVVVGLPLEKPTLETEALIAYYDFKFGRGWDYGYIYPAMNRALQAAGRCIRSETDRGAIVLMDDRFNWQNYKKCFPKDMNFIVTEKPEEHVGKFFNRT